MRFTFAVLLAGACCTACLFGGSLTARADDWPQWLGPDGASIWHEDGIVERFPKKGLKVKWRTPVGLGYSGPAVAGGKVFLMDYVPRSGEVSNSPGGRVHLEGEERVLCFDANTGRLLWKHAYDRPYRLSYPSGPRCTPAVDEGRVYALGAEGTLSCLDTETGKPIWQRELTEDYDTSSPIWGYAAHPLIDGDLLYCIAGGEGSLAVAFDKRTGKEVWKSLSARSQGYCPPTMIELDGRRQLVIWHPEAINGLDPATGNVHWSVPLEPDYDMSIAAPRLAGDKLFASGIGQIGALLQLDPQRQTAEVLWRGTAKDALYSANSTPFVEEGMIYGVDCQSGALIGARLEDGERLWETRKPTSGGERRQRQATAFLVKHKDRFFLFSETGDLILAHLTPEGYEELDRFQVLEPTGECFGRPVVWNHPAFAERCVFVRNDKELVCVDLSASGNQ
jgi:outer membrane protein assembly factor BamB